MGKKTFEHGRRYECRNCRYRMTLAESYRATCPKCGGRLQNAAVPRE